MPTISDVAKRAGVSRSTVSLVLNNSPLTKEETRERVLHAIKEMNYIPNNNARGLSSRTTYNLGIIIMQDDAPRINYDYDQHTGLCSYNISTGIIEGLVDTDYGVVTEYFCSMREPEALPRVIRNNRVDGAFIVGSPYSMQMIQKLIEMEFPFVMVGVNSYIKDVDSVFADPADGVRIAIKHMNGTGHRKLCYINSPDMYASSLVRKETVLSAVNELGLDFDEIWIPNCRFNHGKSSYETFKRFWEAGNRPDGVIAANTQLALGVRRYLYEQRVEVAEEVSIMSCEDSSLSGYATPALTSVNINKELMGRTSAHCLLKKLRNPKKTPERIVTPANLVVRDSVYDRRTDIWERL